MVLNNDILIHMSQFALTVYRLTLDQASVWCHLRSCSSVDVVLTEYLSTEDGCQVLIEI